MTREATPQEVSEVETSPEISIEDMEPVIIPVKMERVGPGDNATFITVALDATATNGTLPVQLLGEDNRRKRALIWSDAVVYIGKRDSVAGGGARVPIGMIVELQNTQEVFVRVTTGQANVSVVNERWN